MGETINNDTYLPEVVRTEDEVKIGNSIRVQFANKCLVITQVFAKNNLSEDAISYAKEVDDCYVWELDKTSWIVLFEIPAVFKADFTHVLRGMIMYNIDYLRKHNLNDNVIYHVFVENQQKKIIF